MALFLINHVFNFLFAERIGALIGRIGERRALMFEYIGLIGVFTAYAFVDNPYIAAGLYVADHMFFALAIAIKTYLQKIADPAEIASTAGVSFTINHIAAVIIPAVLGLVVDRLTGCGVPGRRGVRRMLAAAERQCPRPPRRSATRSYTVGYDVRYVDIRSGIRCRNYP